MALGVAALLLFTGCPWPIMTTPDQAATPTFSPGTGTYSSDQSVTISCATSDATIHYTTDGNAPTTSSAVYGVAIPVAGNGTSKTISAMAVKSGMADSAVATAAISIDYSRVSTPAFSPPAGTYASDQSVLIRCSTLGAAIYYTTDGSPPTTDSNVYSAPISVVGPMTTTTIKAIAVQSGMITSTEASARYNVANNGAGLVSWGGNVYVLGGVDATGAYRSEVWRAPVGPDGALGAWIRDTDLPHALAFAACVAFGNMVYVVGGRDAGGLRDEIYFIRIQPDGTLGFPPEWATNPRSLPAARSGAAPLIVQGRLFLIGGETAAGTQSSIINARFWNDGQVGQWYEAPNPLPAAGTGFAAAACDGKLWVIGGNADTAYSAVLDGSGLPGPWGTGLLGGGPAAFPALASTADGLLAVGGGDADTGIYSKTRRYDGSAWTLSAAMEAFGPHCVVLADTVFVTGSVRGNEPPVLKTIAASKKRADAPRVWPGDGNIRANSSIKAAAYPGDTVRFTTAAYGTKPKDPAEGDPSVSPSLPKVSADSSYAFRAFRISASAEPSEIVYVNYRPSSSSMFIFIQGTIFPQSGADDYTGYSLTETYYDKTSSDVSSVWYVIYVSSPSTLNLGWADATDQPAGAGYGASVCVSLFEDVACSAPVRKSDGSEMYLMTGGYSNPVTAALEHGTYYLHIESSNGTMGGRFGLMVGK